MTFSLATLGVMGMLTKNLAGFFMQHQNLISLEKDYQARVLNGSR